MAAVSSQGPITVNPQRKMGNIPCSLKMTGSGNEGWKEKPVRHGIWLGLLLPMEPTATGSYLLYRSIGEGALAWAGAGTALPAEGAPSPW